MSDGATSADALRDLLARFGAGDPQRAGRAYEQLRGRLVPYFRLSLPDQAEELADLALDRLAKRIAEGVAVEHPAAYVLGIARLVLLEARARQARHQRALADPGLRADADDGSDAQARERALAALQACLDALGPGQAALILDYYGAGGGRHIDGRQRFAAALGIGLNALRNRALRLRAVLQRCVDGKLDGDGVDRDESAPGATGWQDPADDAGDEEDDR